MTALFCINVSTNVVKFIAGMNDEIFAYYFLVLVINLNFELFFFVMFSFFLLYMADVDFKETYNR